MLLGVGTLHFWRPNRSTRSFPPSCPASARFYTYASGVAEVGVGPRAAATHPADWPRSRRPLLFIGVFPANVNMCRLWWNKPWPMRIAALARLPLQIPMITTALKISRNS